MIKKAFPILFFLSLFSIVGCKSLTVTTAEEEKKIKDDDKLPQQQMTPTGVNYDVK